MPLRGHFRRPTTPHAASCSNNTTHEKRALFLLLSLRRLFAFFKLRRHRHPKANQKAKKVGASSLSSGAHRTRKTPIPKKVVKIVKVRRKPGMKATNNGLVWPEDEYVDETILEDHLGPPRLDYDALVMLANLPPLPEEIKNRLAALPVKTRSAPEYTLVLDLDETLVHCSLTPLENAQMVFPVVFQNVTYQVYVRLRPHLRPFLKRMAKTFEIIIFTASKKVYANKLCDILDPQKNLIRHRLFREHCVCVFGNYVKDLTILGRDPSKTMILDNAIQSFSYQLDNGIPIESWFEDRSDKELLKLSCFLETIPAMNRDVREVLHNRYRLRDHVPFYSIVHQQEIPLSSAPILTVEDVDDEPSDDEQLITQVTQKPQLVQG